MVQAAIIDIKNVIPNFKEISIIGLLNALMSNILNPEFKAFKTPA